MQFWDIFSYSFRHLQHRGLRTWLTLLGVIVGIAAVVLLVGLAQGMKASIEDELSAFGPDLMIIVPVNVGGGSTFSGPASFTSSSGRLYEKDVDVVKRADGVEAVTKAILTNSYIKYKKSEITSSIYGLETDTYQQTMVFADLEEGRFLESGDRKVVLIGDGIAHDKFDEDVSVNSFIEISGQKYQVIGILAKSGSSYSSSDNMIIIPFDDAREIAGNTLAEREIHAMRIKISPGYDPIEVEDNINFLLMAHRGVTEDTKDFGIVSARFIQEQVDSILGALTLFLMIVSGVSLLVGAIGISNTMFMSVLERTREIGVLKSIGATSSQIQRLFLMEATLIGMFGGILGLVFGAFLVSLVSFLGFKAVLSVEMALLAFAVSAGVGIFAGAFPAKRASEVPAVEALRYE